MKDNKTGGGLTVLRLFLLVHGLVLDGVQTSDQGPA
jgi:hypothetical protein